MKNNKEQIVELVKSMLNASHEAMLKKVNEVLDSGCVDVNGWDKDNSPMILPKSIWQTGPLTWTMPPWV